jgi:hypothetical protein
MSASLGVGLPCQVLIDGGAAVPVASMRVWFGDRLAHS